MSNDNLAKTDRSRYTSDKWRIRPNNYVILAPILRDDSIVHLPSVKKTGWHGSTVREYERMQGVTVERTTRNVLFYLKRRFIRFVTTSEEIDRVEKEVKNFLISTALKFQERYPTIVLDLMNAKFIRKEIEVKDPKLKIPKNLLMQDTIFKKVYKKDDSFEVKTLRSPELLKQYIKNRAIEDWSPELVKELNDIKQLMQGLIPTQQAISNTQLMMVNLLKKMSEKENMLSKFWKFIKKKVKS